MKWPRLPSRPWPTGHGREGDGDSHRGRHAHEGRHTTVSIMSSNGVPIQEISDTVGHKSTHVIETVYRHVIVPAIRGGATVIDDVFSDDEDDDEGNENAQRLSGLQNPFWPPQRPAWLPSGICTGNSLVRGGLAGDPDGSTQKVTANTKTRPDLQKRASRLVGPEASGRPCDAVACDDLGL